MAREGLDLDELLQRAAHALEAEHWETANAYAGAILERDPSNFWALTVAQTAIIHLIAPAYPADPLVQRLFLINESVRKLDTR